MNIFRTKFFAHKKKKTDKSTILFVSLLLKHSRHFDYWNQTLNMRIRVSYLDYYETGLCSYLVKHIETYYFHYSCFTSICDLLTDSVSYMRSS
jgi:hypothetical protein